MKKIGLILFLACLFLFKMSFAQSLDELLNEVDVKAPKEYTTATFKTTRLINFHTTDVLGKKCLDFRISHRFGDINSGAYNAWGLDGGANIRLGLEYSHDARLMFGIGCTSSRKFVDGFVKYKLFGQTTDNASPVTITLFSGAYHTFERVQIDGTNKYQRDFDRLSYCHQIMIGRKFNERLSAQSTGALIHFNLVDAITENNNCYVVGGLVRYKVSKRQAITVEYGLRLNKYSANSYYDSFGVGYELETGGHVFQVNFTNSFGLTENQYFMYTSNTWSNWGVRLGFNISRVFSLGGK
jgi:hypothetical protein